MVNQLHRVFIFVVTIGLLYTAVIIVTAPGRFTIGLSGSKKTVDNEKVDITSLRLTNSSNRSETVAGLCPLKPPGLTGIWKASKAIVEWQEQEKAHSELFAGGAWRPQECIARNRVAILIPYRARDEHLHIFINNMHGFLQRQQHDYRIYVIEQMGTAPFNRALLFNIGFKEAMKDQDWQCFVFHDVDHIPLNDKNMYSCPRLPMHLAVAVERRKFRLPYNSYFGGVSMMKKEHYEKINGMSNSYWGWGAEDDDVRKRCRIKKLTPILRYPAKIARYASIQEFHHRAPRNKQRRHLLKWADKRIDQDGLNSVKYIVAKKEYRRLFTYILADVSMMEKAHLEYMPPKKAKRSKKQ